MVWYRLEPQLCKVVTHLAPRPAPGDNWCNIAPPKTDSYPVHIWNQKYPAFKVAVPAHCGTPLPGSSTPPQQPSQPIKKYPGESPSSSPVTGPVTGPKDDPCAPAMAERAGSEAKYGFKTGEHLLMPRTGTFFSVRTGADHVGASVEPGYTGKPLETRPARVKSSGGMITIAEPGSGDGFIVFAPDDLNEFCLRGDGVHPEGKWPAKIAQNTFLIMSGASAGGGDNVRNLLAWGMPSARTRGKPVSGVYIEHDPDTNVINIQHTDSDGDDTSVSGGVTIDGVAVGTGTGDVVGPASATDSELALFDGTTGKLLKGGSGITGPDILTKSGNLSGIADAGAARSNIGAGTGDGDVTAASNMTDDTLLRGDGGAKGIQHSELTLSNLSASAVTISTVTAATAITLQAKKATGNNNGGSLTIRAGNAETSLGTGNGGALALDGGSEGGAGGTEGAISIGTTYAGSVAIAKTGVTTTINGPTVGKSSIKSDHATAGIGYATGAGGTVTQATSKSTGVTLNKACGQITTHAESLGDYSSTAFTVTNSAVAVGDTVVLSLAETGVEETGFSARSYVLSVENVVAGAFDIVIWNFSGGALAEALVIDFAVVKAVTG